MELHVAVIYGFPYKLRPKLKIAFCRTVSLVSSPDPTHAERWGLGTRVPLAVIEGLGMRLASSKSSEYVALFPSSAIYLASFPGIIILVPKTLKIT